MRRPLRRREYVCGTLQFGMQEEEMSGQWNPEASREPNWLQREFTEASHRVHFMELVRKLTVDEIKIAVVYVDNLLKTRKEG
jgi:hypothetical protein